MTTTPPEAPVGPPADQGPRVTTEEVRDLARIRRTIGPDRKLAGVAGGLARHLDIDPVIVRVAFVVLTFFGGVGLLLYLALWLLLPEEGSEWGRVALDRRSRGVALVLVGVLALVILFSHGWWGGGVPWALLIIGGLVAVVVTQLPSRRAHRGEDTTAPGAPSYDDAGVPVGAAVQQTGEAPAASSYDWQSHAGPSYAYVEQPRPVNPRKRGPILFWFTLALMAVALGGLGIADLAGMDVAPSAYPATVLAISGAVLLLGAFFGRAGGLILVGLVASVLTAGTTVADRWHPDHVSEVPTTASAVQSDYRLDVGDLVVDLTGVSNPAALDGRVIHASVGVGHLEVRVPPGVTVVTAAHIDGPGGINAFGQNTGGFGAELDNVHQGGKHAPTLTVDAHVHVGAIDLTEESR